MFVQSSSVPRTVTLPSRTFEMLRMSNCELKEKYNESERNVVLLTQRNNFLENENTELRNENDILRRIEREYKELIKQNLQSSKTTLQYTYAITGAILGSGAVLVCPMSSN